MNFSNLVDDKHIRPRLNIVWSYTVGVYLLGGGRMSAPTILRLKIHSLACEDTYRYVRYIGRYNLVGRAEYAGDRVVCPQLVRLSFGAGAEYVLLLVLLSPVRGKG